LASIAALIAVGCGGSTASEPGTGGSSGNTPTPAGSTTTPNPDPTTTTSPTASPTPSVGPVSACADAAGTGLAGVAFDVTKSRFAFGSTPVQLTTNGFTRWTGADGQVAVGPFGRAMGSMNSGASQAALPDWSEDPDALTTHVRDYFVGMGIPTCQIARTDVTASVGSDGSHSRMILLERALDGIPVIDSRAGARINSADQSTNELLFWPGIPAAVVTAARSFRAQVADPTALAAYKAKLPAAAQGVGEVVIHHSAIAFMPDVPFDSATTWDTIVSSATRSYDANGVEVMKQW
jgi:hypothetical protein